MNAPQTPREPAVAGSPASGLFGDHSPECDVNDANPDGIHKPCNCGQTTRNFFVALAEVCAHVTHATDSDREALHAIAAKCADEALSPNDQALPQPADSERGRSQ